MKGYKVEGKYRKNLSGWWDESERHSLARMGIKTKPSSNLLGATLWNENVRKMTLNEFLNSDFDNDGVKNKFDKYPFNPVNYRYKVDFSKSPISHKILKQGQIADMYELNSEDANVTWYKIYLKNGYLNTDKDVTGIVIIDRKNAEGMLKRFEIDRDKSKVWIGIIKPSGKFMFTDRYYDIYKKKEFYFDKNKNRIYEN